jgi:hypothetical protein
MSRAICLILLVATSPAFAQESDSAARKARLQRMESTIAGFVVKSDGQQAAPKFAAKPLLRYSDPTRGVAGENVLLDAGVWRLGESGRPRALVTLELYGADEGATLLSYEFLSLSEPALKLSHKKHDTVAWESAGRTSLKFAPLPEAPEPSPSAAGRLVQMRELARRFEAIEVIKMADVKCRLLSQPIDRYQSVAEGIIDGALFVYANGTNPELGVLIESDGKGYSFAPIRLTSAESRVELGGKEVARFSSGDFRGVKGDYSAAHHAIEGKSSELR